MHAPLPELQEVPALSQDGPAPAVSLSSRAWPVHFSRAMENAFDSYHFWEVHRWFPFNRSPESATAIEQDDHLLQIVTTGDSGPIEGSPAMLYPNLWVQRLPGFATISIAFVPVAERHTDIHLRVDLQLTHLPGVRGAIAWLANRFWAFALWQDSAVVARQEPLRTEDTHEHDVLLGYDRAMAASRRLRRRTVRDRGQYLAGLDPPEA